MPIRKVELSSLGNGQIPIKGEGKMKNLKPMMSVFLSAVLLLAGLATSSCPALVRADTIGPILPGTIVWQRITGPWDFTNDGSYASFGAIAIDPSNPDVIYLGNSATNGGLGMYKSANGGASWASINNGIKQIGLTTKYYPAISKIAISPSNPKVIYIGTGGSADSILIQFV